VARRVRFPISAKILLWFFLNVAFLGAAAWIFARVQLRFGLDSLLAGPVNDRLQTMGEVLSRQLNERPPSKWPGILENTAASYRVQLALYRHDGRLLAGTVPSLPPEVLQRITEARPRDGQRDRPEERRDRPPEVRRDGDIRDPFAPNPPPRDGNPPPPNDRPPQDFRPDRPHDHEAPPPALAGGFPKSILHTAQPNLYWVFLRLPVVDRSIKPPMPTTVVLATASLRGGGLLFDFTPWIIGGAVVFALSVLMWLPLVRGITGTLRKMTGAAESIAQGRFETQVPEERADELGRLGTALNHMSARLREFFTGQKRFLGDIAHELCSPLARMEMALGILDQRADEKQRHYVADVREELRHMSELVHELLSFSKAGVGGKNVELKPVALAELASRVVAREARDRGGVIVDLPSTLRVLAEPDLLARALGNVIRNALRYASPIHAEAGSYSYRPAVDAEGRPAGPITISAREDGPRVILSITDCGPGVPEETLHRLFDPFFRPESARTRETGGAGLGLAIVKSCIEASGGTVSVRNVQPSGLQVDFTLQRA
jgi:two-component system sensor histidine kinase CpxA